MIQPCRSRSSARVLVTSPATSPSGPAISTSSGVLRYAPQNTCSAGSSIFASSGFENLRLYPGDTIVVPEKLIRPSGLRNFAAWTGMLYQYSLSAAVIDAVK